MWKFAWAVKAKHCWLMSTNLLFSKLCWQQLAMFCLIDSNKLFSQKFGFSLKVKMMGSNPGHLLKYFYFNVKIKRDIFFILCPSQNIWPLSNSSYFCKMTFRPLSTFFSYTFCKSAGFSFKLIQALTIDQANCGLPLFFSKQA